MRRELKKLSPDVRIDIEQIAEVLRQEVIKREVLDGEKFGEAQKQITRAAIRQQKENEKKALSSLGAETAGDTIPAVTTVAIQ